MSSYDQSVDFEQHWSDFDIMSSFPPYCVEKICLGIEL